MSKLTVLPRLAGLLLLALLLVYLHPYHGLRHDSILYLGQALLRARPDEFGLDLFFAFGSQASFTLFPDFVAFLLQATGVSAPVLFMWLTAASSLCFLLASGLLVRRLFPETFHFWVLLALLVMPAGYGGHKIFAYLEPFFTARSVAEPLVLLALALWFGNRRVWALMAWMLAAVCHPLQALPAVLLVWLDLVLADRRWLHLLWPGVLLFALGLMGWAPAGKLVQVYDEQWFKWIVVPSPHLFVFSWQPDAYAYLLLDLFVAFLTWQRASSELMSRFARSVLLATGVAFVASAVLADGLHLVLPTSLQLWRMHWILHWFAMAAAPWLLISSVRLEGGRSLRTLLLLACLAFGVQTGGLGISPFVVPILMLLYLFLPRIEGKISASIQKLLFAVVVGVIFLGVLKFSYGIFLLSEKYGGDRSHFREEFVLLSFPLIAVTLMAGGVALWRHIVKIRAFLIFFLVLGLLYAFQSWDRRTVWTQYIESAQNSENIFGVEIEPGAQVFWDGELLAPWLILNRPVYFDGQQTAGLAFSRGTAEEAYKRKDVMEIVQVQRQICSVVNSLQGEQSHCRIDNDVVADACRKSEGKLGYLVLDDALNAPAIGSWKIKGGMVKDKNMTYYLYRCKDFVGKY
ncbi:hypothetical protein [Uliginosibacterium aquaticum]|uniref:Uncharacterized protein n=1 Tax=Uliginosibacterium aquaticum TaxID=2731212 RepID=A0ABX2ILY4_9RHOO|nr:hypothetical protein [Uliginosibacterium aquaticum]NSL55313.1 hypothetical protein [Uliginosibacterium aquaticum]